MKRAGIVVVLVSILVCGQALADTFLSYEASPSAWVGNGGEPHYTTPADGTVFDPRTEYSNGLRIWMPNNTTFDDWDVTFWPATGQTLAVGKYSDFIETPDATHAAMSFTSTGRGPTAASGWFEILELELGVGGVPTKLAADFVQYEEGSTEKYVRGSIRYNSDIPATFGPNVVPATSKTGLVILAGALAVAGCFVAKRRLGRVS